MWACEICILARGALSLLRQGEAAAPLTVASVRASVRACVRAELVKMISTREEIDGEREVPLEPARGETEGGPFWIPSSNSK